MCLEILRFAAIYSLFSVLFLTVLAVLWYRISTHFACLFRIVSRGFVWLLFNIIQVNHRNTMRRPVSVVALLNTVVDPYVPKVLIVLVRNCVLTWSSATIFSTAFAGSVDSRSLEKEQGEEHDWETYVDCDDHRPVRKVVFYNWYFNFLVCEFKVAVDLALIMDTAESHYEYLIRAFEWVRLSSCLVDYQTLGHWLVHVEVRFKGRIEVYLATWRNFGDGNIDPDRVHFGPKIWLQEIFSALVLNQVIAGTLWLRNCDYLLLESCILNRGRRIGTLLCNSLFV